MCESPGPRGFPFRRDDDGGRAQGRWPFGCTVDRVSLADVAPLFVPFLGGLAGSLHCVGMCGGFPVALRAGGPGMRRQLLYNAGRLNTLAFLGAVAGGAGAAVVAAGPLHVMERALAIVGGAIIVAAGLEMLGLLPWRPAFMAPIVNATLGRLLSGTMRSPSWVAPLALGVFNAFLPCQLIYAFVAQAVATGSAFGGLSVMLAFGLGTVPAMLTLGTVRLPARPVVRASIARLSGLLVVGFGLFTLLRGLATLHAHHH